MSFRSLTMLRYFIASWLIAIVQMTAQAQLLPRLHLMQYELNDKKWGKVRFCVTSKDVDKRKPLLLYLDGSGDRPLFRFIVDTAQHSTMLHSTITINYDSMAAYYHIVFIAKPGVKLVDSVFVQSKGSYKEEERPPLEYTKRLSGDWRSHSASMAVDFLLAKLPVDRKKVAVVGYSEGAQIAP